MTNGKEKVFTKSHIIIMILSIVLFFIIIVLITMFASSVSISDFEVSDFEIEPSTSTSWDEYRGTGTITCTDKANSYTVLIKKTNLTDDEITYDTCLVINGEGTFTTSDVYYVEYILGEEVDEPEYEFEIVGYTEFINY